MSDVTIWFNPARSKCRTAHGLLEERGVAADYVSYLDQAPTRAVVARPPERILELLDPP